MTEAAFLEIEEQVKKEIEAAVEFAENSPIPGEETLETDIFA